MRSSRDQYESILSGVYPVHNQELADAFEAVIEEAKEAGEEEGYNLCIKDSYREGELSEKSKDLLVTRYHYLRHGGEWQRDLLPSDEFASPADNYAAGYLDAMRTIGVKP